MQLNSIYTTFSGEQSKYGIGAPIHFIRLQGCHIRCYQSTLGILCDTPEGLDPKGGQSVAVPTIMAGLNKLRENSGGVNLVCVSGGDPLWRKPQELHELFRALREDGYKVIVETSGTLSMQPYNEYYNVSWILDYKVKSAGVAHADTLLADVKFLTPDDRIKFVLYDQNDYDEFKEKLATLKSLRCSAGIVVGVFWGGPTTTFQLIDWLIKDKLLGSVQINMQAHKALYSELDTVKPELT